MTNFSTVADRMSPTTSTGALPDDKLFPVDGTKGGTLSEESDETKMPRPPTSHESPLFFYDELVNKFINCMMWDGKKSVSRKIFEEAMQIIKMKQLAKFKSDSSGGKHLDQVDPLKIFHEALENAMPVMGTMGIKKGGKTYHVPVALPFKRQRFLGIKWIITAARERKGLKMADKLAAELLDAYNNTGTAIKRKQDSHRLAEANRAFAHFRWS